MCPYFAHRCRISRHPKYEDHQARSPTWLRQSVPCPLVCGQHQQSSYDQKQTHTHMQICQNQSWYASAFLKSSPKTPTLKMAPSWQISRSCLPLLIVSRTHLAHLYILAQKLVRAKEVAMTSPWNHQNCHQHQNFSQYWWHLGFASRDLLSLLQVSENLHAPMRVSSSFYNVQECVRPPQYNHCPYCDTEVPSAESVCCHWQPRGSPRVLRSTICGECRTRDLIQY